MLPPGGDDDDPPMGALYGMPSFEEDLYTVLLVDCGPERLSVLAALRRHLGLSLPQAKALVDGLPVVLAHGQTPEEASALRQALSARGAVVRLDAE